MTDGVVRKLIDKWLKASVLESGEIIYPTQGTPQGGVISPLLANIYLHYVLDDWFAETVQPRMWGRCSLTRFADDFVMVFANPEDCRRVEAVLPKRFERFGLKLHPEKTRCVDFRPYRRNDNKHSGLPVSFDFLGFTHFWRISRKGNTVVCQKTAKGRIAKSLKAFNDYCRKHRHKPLGEQYDKLNRKLRGHYAYFGITGNAKPLYMILHNVKRIWRKWLSRRSQKSHINWEKFNLLLDRFPLAQPKIHHQYSCGY